MEFELIPARTALINVDMQDCFVEGSPISAQDGVAVLGRINRLSAVCRAAGMAVIHTSYILRPDGSNAGVAADLPPIKAGVFYKGSPAAALHKDLVVDPRDILLDKPRYGAFHGTDLELILRTRGIASVIISGIATNVCCDTTAREAAARDFHVFFLSDGTSTCGLGDVSADQFQQATLATLGFAVAHVLTVDEMIHEIGAASR
jgi:ureidoacrylate peracid hydrolase